MRTTIILLAAVLFCISSNAQNSGELANRIRSMTRETDPQKNVASMGTIIRDYKLDSTKDAESIDVMKGIVALGFLKTGLFQDFEIYISLIKNKFNQTSYLNMAADILYKDAKQKEYAEKTARRTVELYESYQNDSTAKPDAFPLEDWNRFVKMAAYPYYNTYAETLHANGKDKAALLYLEKALKGQEPEDLEQSSAELYTALLASQGKEDTAYAILLTMAGSGKSNRNMDLQLKQLYIKRSTGVDEAKASAFLDSIQKNVSSAYKTELTKKMILNREAPGFQLYDLDGKLITLTAFKGKTVVLDFWATWCAPCIASMPAMETLSKKHPEVVFLFIATQETAPDAEARVRSFVKKHAFRIKVLMDTPMKNNPNLFRTAVAYQLTGIPAKIVIDKEGKLRFSTAGYLSDTELTNELEAMIAVAKEQ